MADTSSFTPRPFPPQDLAGVPEEYILAQLTKLAPLYWNKDSTSDCTIVFDAVIPVPHPRRAPIPTSAPPLPDFMPIQRNSTIDPMDRGRRATAPALNAIPRISMKLHMDYLSAHSTFLRALFSGASPLDLINGASIAHPRTPNAIQVPANRLPRLLPSPPSRPTLLLPVPDPSSFPLLVHWMYFGKTEHISAALVDCSISWQGLARNVEYLGLSAEIKIFLGKYYSAWLDPNGSRPKTMGEDEEEDGDEDEVIFSDDSEDEDYPSSSTLLEDDDSDDEPLRGRARDPRDSFARASSV